MLEKIGSQFMVAIDYLRSLRALHTLMVSKTLDTEYPRIIREFRALFDKVYKLGLVEETPKCHLLYDHLEDYFDTTNETLWYADTSGNVKIIFFD